MTATHKEHQKSSFTPLTDFCRQFMAKEKSNRLK